MSVNKKIIETEAVVPEYDFAVTTYTGNSNFNQTQSITTGLQPDLVFARNADTTLEYATGVFDSTRGATKYLKASGTNAETTNANLMSSFDSDGFTVGSEPDFNNNGNTYNSFSIKANGGTTSSNTNGTITSTVQANQEAGFSIVKYTGNNTGSNQTIGHGLSATPEIIILKGLDRTSDWAVIATNAGVGPGDFLQLNGRSGASGSGTIFGYPSDTGVSPTSTVFTVGGNNTSNATGEDYVAYCSHSVEGFSKIGSFTGNSAANSVTVGFLPKFLMVKKSSGYGTWYIYTASGMTTQSYGYSGNSGMTIGGQNTLPTIQFRSDNGGQFAMGQYDYDSNFNLNGETFIYWCVGGDKTNVL